MVERSCSARKTDNVQESQLFGAGMNLLKAGGLSAGETFASLGAMSVQVNLPEELAAQIDDVADDRAEFVAEAVRRLLRDSAQRSDRDEIAKINAFADELNAEAADVLEYQVIP